eukprot:11275300-Karenia_brevis.AAC.1
MDTANTTLFANLPEARPLNWRDWLEEPVRKLQKLFTLKLDEILLKAWTNEASPQDIVRRLNQSSPLASAWVNARPVSSDFVLMDP